MKLVFKASEMKEMSGALTELFMVMGQDNLIPEMFDDINALDEGMTIEDYPYTLTKINDEYIFEMDDELIVNTTKIMRKYTKPIGGVIKGIISIMESLSSMLEQLFDEISNLCIESYRKHHDIEESEDEEIIINEDEHVHLSEEEVRELFEQEPFKSEVNKNMEE